MSHSQEMLKSRSIGGAVVLLFGMWILLASHASAAGGGAVVSGVVRDASGVAQMGALVQVVSSGSHTVATAFTDQHGRYLIANLIPGNYAVRASQTLFVPATRGNLQLHTGATAIVNLTLAALFDTASWLPAERRRASEAEDDWKWTLRSAANRPILRMVEDGVVVEMSSSVSESKKGPATSVRAAVSSGDGGFGEGGVHNILTMHRTLDDGAVMLLRADVASNRVPASYGPSQELDAGYEQTFGFNGAARTVVSYKAHPELMGGGGEIGVTVLEVASGQRFNVGDLMELEAGGSLTAIHTAGTALAAHPFVKMTAHAGGVWTLRYRLASSRVTQTFDDLDVGHSDVPVALVENGRLTLEQGTHQEASVARGEGRAGIAATLYRDRLDRTVLSGGGAAGPAETMSGNLQAGMLVDPTTGTFKTFGAGYTSNGVRLSASAPLTPGLWIAAEYSSGEALASQTGSGERFNRSLARMTVKNGEAATIALKGKLMSTKTQVRASYRWQPAEFVSAIDPYSDMSYQAFLSCSIRQPIHLREHFPQGLAATIDVTNLLAEGYRPFVSDDGRTLYFAQAPRAIQGGLSFTF